MTIPRRNKTPEQIEFIKSLAMLKSKNRYLGLLYVRDQKRIAALAKQIEHLKSHLFIRRFRRVCRKFATKIPFLVIILLLSGCFFARVDIEEGRQSGTIWTLLKEFDIEIDPNTVVIRSRSEDAKVYSPYGVIETGD